MNIYRLNQGNAEIADSYREGSLGYLAEMTLEFEMN